MFHSHDPQHDTNYDAHNSYDATQSTHDFAGASYGAQAGSPAQQMLQVLIERIRRQPRRNLIGAGIGTVVVVAMGAFSDDGYDDGYGYDDPYAYGAEYGGGYGPEAGPAPEGYGNVSYEGGAGQTPRGMKRIVEPNEQAFSIAVPDGWQAQLMLDVRKGKGQVGRISSADGKTLIFFGDPNVPMFMDPRRSPMGMVPQNMAASPYQSAEQFARGYVQQAFGQGAPVSFEEPNAAPQWSAQIEQQLMASTGQRVEADAVIARFSTQAGGQRRTGRIEAFTVPMGNGMWFAEIRGFLTAGDRSAAERINPTYEKVIASIQGNQQWHQANLQRINRDGQARMRASAAQHQQRMAMRQQSFNAHQQRMAQMGQMADANFQNWRSNQAAADSSYQSWRNNQAIADRGYELQNQYNSGQQEVWGPNGERGLVDMGSERYYVDPTGENYIGSDSAFDRNDLQLEGWQEWQTDNPNGEPWNR